MRNEATVFINGDDVFEELFEGARVFQSIALDAGLITHVRYGLHRLTARPDEVARSACFVLYTGRGTFTPEQQHALADLVADGSGLVVIHSANVLGTDTDGRLVADYRTAFDLIGSRYASHGPEPRWSDVTVRFTGEHPVTRGVTEFTTFLEHYRIEQADDRNEVLAIREAPYGPEPLLYTRTHGRGRVVYLQLGHDQRTFGEPAFQQLLRQGIAWCAEPAREVAGV